MARDLTEVMWGKWVQALCSSSAGKGLDPATVMPTSGLTYADWEVMDITGLPPDSAAGAKGTVKVPSLMQWANVMPQWSPNYAPSSNNFYDNYVAFLNSIALKGGNAGLQQIADGYGANLAAATKKLSDARAASNAAWAEFNTSQASLPPNAQTPYAQWYQDNSAATINSLENGVAAQATKYNQAMAQVGGPDYKTISGAQQKANLQAGSSGLVYPAGVGGQVYPAYSASPDLNDWYVQALQSLASSAPPQIDFTLTLADDDKNWTGQSSYFNAAAQVSYSAFFWGGSAAASYGQSKGAQTYDSLVQNMTMHYTAQSAGLFNFGLGSWYDSSMIKLFADQISPTSALAGKPMGGEDGYLNLRVAQVLVVMGASVTITGDSQTISQMANQFSQNSSASVSAGGFGWSASASMNQGASNFDNDIKVSTDGTSITMKDNTNAPKVILVVPDKPA